MTAEAPRLTMPVAKRDHVFGPRNAPLTLLEYGDYECLQCGGAHPQTLIVRERLGDRLRFVFRHSPLVNIHRRAMAAAQTAEFAGAHGKFWEMHDVLFQNQSALDEENLLGYAAALGLDADRLSKHLSAGTYFGRVREDLLSGVRSAVNGTPTFFINGLRYLGPYDAASLIRAIAPVTV